MTVQEQEALFYNTPLGFQQRCWETTAALTAMDTSESSHDTETCVAWLKDKLNRAHFEIEIHHNGDAPPMLIARREALVDGRPANQQGSTILVYNHYDVDEPTHAWSSDPFTLTHQGERWAGLGVADNKGALAARLVALSLLKDRCPALVWVIQGQEESGSSLARQWFSNASPDCDVWIEENGWTDPDGTQRLLAVRRDNHRLNPPKKDTAEKLLKSLGGNAPRRLEARLMNKSLVPGGCPFQSALPNGALYLSFGTNDAQTRIHAADESIADNAVARHAHQFAALLNSFC